MSWILVDGSSLVNVHFIAEITITYDKVEDKSASIDHGTTKYKRGNIKLIIMSAFGKRYEISDS